MITPDSLPLPPEDWERQSREPLTPQEVPTPTARTLGETGTKFVVRADLLGTTPEWQERALCSQTDPEMFFPEKGGSPQSAKRICARCDVKAECLEYALSFEVRFGIWGGLTERERRRILKRG